jgi:hypothetical protein
MDILSYYVVVYIWSIYVSFDMNDSWDFWLGTAEATCAPLDVTLLLLLYYCLFLLTITLLIGQYVDAIIN